MHQQITLTDYVVKDDIFAPFINGNGSLTDVKSLHPSMEDMLLALYIYLLIDMPAPPLCQDFSKYFLDAAAKKLHNEFVSDMNQLHREIEQRNKQRVEKFCIFDPWCMAITSTA